jgi:hypothetical protein
VEAQNSSINEFGKTGLDNFLLIEERPTTSAIGNGRMPDYFK